MVATVSLDPVLQRDRCAYAFDSEAISTPIRRGIRLSLSFSKPGDGFGANRRQKICRDSCWIFCPGVAWSLFGNAKTAVRSKFGIYCDQLFGW